MVRIALDLEIDARGAVARVAARIPTPFDAGGAAACVETAVKSGLLLTRPEHGKPTTARVEVLLAVGLAKLDSGRL
jgi:hypothetical protein